MQVRIHVASFYRVLLSSTVSNLFSYIVSRKSLCWAMIWISLTTPNISFHEANIIPLKSPLVSANAYSDGQGFKMLFNSASSRYNLSTPIEPFHLWSIRMVCHVWKCLDLRCNIFICVWLKVDSALFKDNFLLVTLFEDGFHLPLKLRFYGITTPLHVMFYLSQYWGMTCWNVSCHACWLTICKSLFPIFHSPVSTCSKCVSICSHTFSLQSCLQETTFLCW